MRIPLFTHLAVFFLITGTVGAQRYNSKVNDSLKVTPRIINIQDNVERTILDYSVTDDLGINQVTAPKNWTEKIVRLQFEIRGIVLDGKLGLEYQNGTFFYSKNEGFILPKNTKVRIFNAGDSNLHLIEVMRPGYKPEFVEVFSEF